jgi:hypothetical protein
MTRIADGNWTKVRSAESVAYLQKKGRAAGRARQRLVVAHRAEYERYLAEEKVREGIAP